MVLSSEVSQTLRAHNVVCCVLLQVAAADGSYLATFGLLGLLLLGHIPVCRRGTLMVAMKITS